MDPKRPNAPDQKTAAASLTGSTWDSSAESYLAEWVPRFLPYHREMIDELALTPGDRVLVVAAGPASEALLAARRVGPSGVVVATDTSSAMLAHARAAAVSAGLAQVSAEVRDCDDASGGPWDAIICAFSLWQIDDEHRRRALTAWQHALSPHGKVALLVWGPPDDADPFQRFTAILQEAEPNYPWAARRRLATRDWLSSMFEEAGLSMVRCTVMRHTQTFGTAEAFVAALRDGCTFRKVYQDLGKERFERVAVRFFETVGGPAAPLAFAPPATLAIAARPGANVEIAARPSVRAPLIK